MMHTYRGDIVSSTCKDCKANGTAIPDCSICSCNCQTGIFAEKDIQEAMSIKRAQKDDLQARRLVPIADRRALASLGNLLSNSVKDGIESLRSSKSLVNKTNILSSWNSQARKNSTPSRSLSR